MRMILQALLAGVIAATPLLMANYEEWALIYGVCVLGIAGATALLPSARFSTGTTLEALFLLLLLIVPILVSTLVNLPEDTRVENIVVILFYAMLGIGLLDARKPDSYTKLFWLLAIAHVVVVPILWSELALENLMDFDAVLELRRNAFDFEDNELHPNAIGGMGANIALASLELSVPAVRVALAGYGLFVAWLMSSRGALLTIVIIGLAFAFCRMRDRSHRNVLTSRQTILFLVAGGLAAMMLASSLSNFLFNDVLLIDDDGRGLDSGFSDRATIWQAAYDLWTENLLFGVGYGQHVAQMGLGTYAHNMVLVLLSELGIVGLTGFTVFSGLALRNGFWLLRQGHRGPATYIISTVIAYWGYGLFEGKALSAGTPISAIFFLMCFSSIGYRSAAMARQPETAPSEMALSETDAPAAVASPSHGADRVR